MLSTEIFWASFTEDLLVNKHSLGSVSNEEGRRREVDSDQGGKLKLVSEGYQPSLETDPSKCWPIKTVATTANKKNIHLYHLLYFCLKNCLRSSGGLSYGMVPIPLNSMSLINKSGKKQKTTW